MVVKSTLMLAVSALLLLEKSKLLSKPGWSFVAALSAQSIVRIWSIAELLAPSQGTNVGIDVGQDKLAAVHAVLKVNVHGGEIDHNF
jgi:hypothetical protein